MQKFTGTVVFVSHDRYFIDKLATRVFEIGDGRVEVFPGNYEDYLWRKEGKAGLLESSLLSEQTAASPAPKVIGNHAGPQPTEPEARQKRLNPIKLKQMRERLEEVEEEIARLEAAIAAAETALQNFVSAEETQRQTELLDRSKAELERTMAEWEDLGQQLEASAESINVLSTLPEARVAGLSCCSVIALTYEYQGKEFNPSALVLRQNRGQPTLCCCSPIPENSRGHARGILCLNALLHHRSQIRVHTGCQVISVRVFSVRNSSSALVIRGRESRFGSMHLHRR